MTGTTVAAFEPALDYIVVKLPRFPFDKFPTADRTLGSQMKATGEVMAIDRTFGSALNKALRGLEQAGAGRSPRTRAGSRRSTTSARSTGVGPETDTEDEPIRWIDESGPGVRVDPLRAALRGAGRAAPVSPRPTAACGGSSACSAARPGTDDRRGDRHLAVVRGGDGAQRAARGGRPRPERASRNRDPEAAELLATAKRAGFGDRELAGLAGVTPEGIREARLALGLRPGYAMVDTCAASSRPRPVLLLDLRRGGIRAGGAARGTAGGPRHRQRPVRIGQGIEFDYCAVQAADTLRAAGWQAVMINSNPETVSTDFDASSRLYFEPLDPESVRSVIDAESPDGSLIPAVVAFGGQTPLNLAGPLAAGGVDLLGSDLEAIDQAEERTRFAALLDRLGIPQPEGGMAHSIEEALTLAERISYPVIVRPSFVIGGLAIDFCYSPEDLLRQLAAATVVDPDRPVRIDRYLEGVEVDVDAVSDGERVLIPGLLEHVERAGVHSGDSVGLFPPQTVSEGDQALIVATMERIVLALGAKGLVNAQFIVRDDGVYLIEVNPRASRTVPFLSKVTGVPMVELAVRIALGATLPELGWLGGISRHRPSSR